jgi:release factor glutamine methyltransferase
MNHIPDNHIPDNIAAARSWLEQHLAPISDSPQAEAWQLLEACLERPKHALIGLSSPLTNELTKGQKQQLTAWLARRLEREPLQYILGYAYFYGYAFQVTPAVLIPRPETEVLLQAALAYLTNSHNSQSHPPTVIDVGTGSGALGVSLKCEYRTAKVIASDISKAALEVAQHNAHQLAADITFVPSNLLAAPQLQHAAKQASIIVANLPYLPEDDRSWLRPEVLREPDIALFAGADGLSLAETLIQQAFSLLPAGAKLYLELDPRNIQQAVARASAWPQKDVLADLAGRSRFLLLTR